MRADVKKFFTDSEFSKYYFLALSKQEYLNLSGLKEVDIHHQCNSIGSYIPGGAIVGYLIAKPVYYDMLERVNIEMPYILDEETYRIGNIASDKFYPVIIEEVKEAVGDY